MALWRERQSRNPRNTQSEAVGKPDGGRKTWAPAGRPTRAPLSWAPPSGKDGGGALQCMPGVVVRHERRSDSEVTSCRGRWSCCNRGRRRDRDAQRLGYQLAPGRRRHYHRTVTILISSVHIPAVSFQFSEDSRTRCLPAPELKALLLGSR